MMFYTVSEHNLPGSLSEKPASGRGGPKAPAGCNPTDGTAALQKPWDFLSRATRILRSWEELDR